MNIRPLRVPLLAFLCTILLVGVASLVPHARLWGIDQWGYFPMPMRLAWLVIAVIAGYVAVILASRNRRITEPKAPHFRLLGASLALALAAALIVFRNQVHFLGDGYQLLATLSSNQPFLKPRNFGGMMLPYLLMNWLGGPTKGNALLAYQVVSVASGTVFLVMAHLLARTLADKPVDRLLLWLGLSTGGYMLLFFGYVENYAPFLATVLVFCYIGVSINKGVIRRWWIWPAYLLTVLFHIFGLVLLPSALYQFMKSSPEHSPLRVSRVRWTIWTTGALLAAGTISYLLATDLFFRFALVSVVSTRFTVAGYTLFSGKHLLDWLNLVIALVPGIVLFTLITPNYWRMLKADIAGMRFLTFTSLTLLGLAFLIEPGLGMPRDWDLFACIGVPLAAVGLYATLSPANARTRAIAILVIIANLTLLVPRVATMAIPEAGLQLAKDYVQLDPHKCLTYSSVIVEYVHGHLGADSALALQQAMKPLFPDDRLVDTGLVYLNQARFGEARPYFERAVQANAMNYSAWANIGRVYLETGLYDSAVANLTIAAGINPYSGVIANNLAWAYYYAGRHGVAEQVWLKSRHLDTTNIMPLVGLATLYSAAGNDEKYASYFDSIIQRPDAPPEYLKAMVETYCQSQRYETAAVMLKRATQNGLDSAAVDSVVKKYPALQQYWSAIRRSS